MKNLTNILGMTLLFSSGMTQATEIPKDGTESDSQETRYGSQIDPQLRIPMNVNDILYGRKLYGVGAGEKGKVVDPDSKKKQEVEEMEEKANQRFGGSLLTFQADPKHGILRPAIRGISLGLDGSFSIRTSSKDGGKISIIYKLDF